MGRRPCCSKEGLNKGAWTALEDKILKDYVKGHGEGRWRRVSKESGLKRCGKSCRLRWLNYLRPDIKRGNISRDEEDLIIRLHRLLGNRWSLIAGRLPGRTDNEIKNYWNTNLGKKAQAGNQSDQSKTEKKSMFRQPGEALPESGVTALHCSEVFVTPKQHKVESCSLVKNMAPSNGSSSFTSEEDNSSDFIMDFNMGEICLSEILDSDFTKLSEFNTCYLKNVVDGDGTNYNGCKSELSPFSDETLLFSDEMVENWSGHDCVQAEMPLDFQSLAAFLESADGWIGDDLNIVYQN